jgi:iron(III)-enterobactin esterase
MESADSKIFPGVAVEASTYSPDPADPIISNYAARYSRRVAVYIPKQYVTGTTAPLIVGADGPDQMLFTVLDSMIELHRVPAMIAISIGNGGDNGPGSERGLEYDTMSPLYAEFVEKKFCLSWRKSTA